MISLLLPRLRFLHAWMSLLVSFLPWISLPLLSSDAYEGDSVFVMLAAPQRLQISRVPRMLKRQSFMEELERRLFQRCCSVKKGGSPNPIANPALAALLQYAKDFDIPKDIIERNIKKASEKGQQDFEAVTYEAYGFGGVGIIIEVLTDNLNRAAATVRDVVKKSGCKMADPGSVLFNFRKAGVVNVKAGKVDGDSLLAAAMDSGAEDVVEPTYYEDEDPQDALDKYFKVITPLEQYAAVCKRLQEAGIPVDVECSGLEHIPNTTFEPDDEAIDLNKALIEKLLELDDVDAVYSNQV